MKDHQPLTTIGLPLYVGVPGFADHRGRPWYALCTLTGDIVTWRVQGNYQRRRREPRALTGRKSHQLITPTGERRHITHKSLVYDTLTNHWRENR